MDCSTPGLPVLHYFPELTQTHIHQVGDAIQPPCPLSSPSLPTFHLSQHHINWSKYWRFSLSISPSNEYSGLISLRRDWLDLLAVQETLKSLFQHNSSNAAPILRRSAFFIVQLSHPHMITAKTTALNNTDLCQQSNVSAF